MNQVHPNIPAYVADTGVTGSLYAYLQTIHSLNICFWLSQIFHEHTSSKILVPVHYTRKIWLYRTKITHKKHIILIVTRSVLIYNVDKQMYEHHRVQSLICTYMTVQGNTLYNNDIVYTCTHQQHQLGLTLPWRLAMFNTTTKPGCHIRQKQHIQWKS